MGQMLPRTYGNVTDSTAGTPAPLAFVANTEQLQNLADIPVTVSGLPDPEEVRT